jgi:hypothetical protein
MTDRLDRFPFVWCDTCEKIQPMIFDVLAAVVSKRAGEFAPQTDTEGGLLTLAGVTEHHLAVIVLKVLIQSQARTGLGQDGGERGLAHRMRSKLGLPSPSQHTASPSMMQDRDRRWPAPRRFALASCVFSC